MRMSLEGGMSQSLLSLKESLGNSGGPGEELRRANEGIGEGAENGGGVGNKTAVEIDEAK